MTSMLREVVLHGTAISANSLPYPLAGKTGTTNDFTDAWFVGFSPTLTCGVWMGSMKNGRSARKESGGHAALPLWIDFMKAALEGKDQGQFRLRLLLQHLPHRQRSTLPMLHRAMGKWH